MARNGGFSDYFDIAISNDAIAKSMLAEDVTPFTKWEKVDGRSTPVQQVDKDGTSLWEIQTLMIPHEGDDRKHVAIVPVRLASRAKPVIKVNVPIRFIDFTVRPWNNETGEGLTYKASDFKQE
ncbi:hypothetical protein IHQ75_05865 [Bifidobacterium dentium]|uniref:hypothetical protein n=1 Tax=Bifidobacterium dentium TaxID=1689 RepID=UPI0018C345E5|nr:hypothetical protein [Bifidobacterium dentium]MBF9710490.1 hypothetical protein [Bifidobacterium dentium]